MMYTFNPQDPECKSVKLVYPDGQFGSPRCAGKCGFFMGLFEGMEKPGGNHYFGVNEPQAGQWIMAHLDLDRFQTFEEYVVACRRVYKGNVVREVKRCSEDGFLCKEFNPRTFAVDMYDIIHSAPVRSGGAMPDYLLLTLDQLGGRPKVYYEPEKPDCSVHFAMYWGVFEKRLGHSQGDIVTDERLVGYVHLARIGDMVMYRTIYGHADYLKHGIMYMLHFEIVKWLLESRTGATAGVRFFSYAGFGQGGEGRTLWKKKTLFEPAAYVVRPRGSDPLSSPL